MVKKSKIISISLCIITILIFFTLLVRQFYPQTDFQSLLNKPLAKLEELRTNSSSTEKTQPNITNADLGLTYLRKNFLMSQKGIQKIFSPELDEEVIKILKGTEPEPQSVPVGDTEYLYQSVSVAHPEAPMLNVTFLKIRPQSDTEKPVLENVVNHEKAIAFDKNRYRLYYSQPYEPIKGQDTWMLQQSNNNAASIVMLVEDSSDRTGYLGYVLSLKHDDGESFLKHLKSLKASKNVSSPEKTIPESSRNAQNNYIGWKEASVNSIDGKVSILFPSQFKEESTLTSKNKGKSTDDQGRSIVYYRMSDDYLECALTIVVRDDDLLERLKTLFETQKADDVQPLTVGNYSGIGTTYTDINHGKVWKFEIFFTDQLVVLTQVSMPINADDKTKDKASLFLNSLAID